MDKQDTVDVTDSRIKHLRLNPSVSFQDDKVKNHWSDLSSILMSTEHPTTRVYCFDGELDDQMRLENILLHASSTDPIIVVAGMRLDGQDTVEELTQVVRKTLRTEVSEDKGVEGWPRLSIIPGGPLLVKSKSQEEMLSEAVGKLKTVLKGQPFVFHNNTSATYLEAVLLDLELRQQVKAVTFTCGVSAPADAIIMGSNAGWNLDAFFHCLQLCEVSNIPFVSFHSTLNNWRKTTLPGEAMLLPVASTKEKILYCKVVSFSYVIVLSWLATAYARATGEDRQAVLDRINPWMGEHGKLSQADPVLFDEKWMTFMNENLTEDDFSETDQSRVHRRFGSVAINLGFAYSNTIGDVSGCVADMPTCNDVIAMRVRNTGDRSNWKAVIGDHNELPSTHYAVVWADEDRTLDKAWSAIKSSRLAHPVEGGYLPVDDAMKRGWQAFADLAEHLLDGIWAGRANFPEQSLVWLERARHNVRKGPWAEYCGRN